MREKSKQDKKNQSLNYAKSNLKKNVTVKKRFLGQKTFKISKNPIYGKVVGDRPQVY